MSQCPCPKCRGSNGPPSRASSPEPPSNVKTKRHPQETVDKFWESFPSKNGGKVTRIIPDNPYAAKATTTINQPSTTSTNVQTSYEEAAALCRAKVDKIVKECRRVNKKYRDLHFDIEADLRFRRNDCLRSLVNDMSCPAPGLDLNPKSAKRIPDIFDKPEFYINGPTANDVRQGRDGDCWLMAALCTLSNKPGLIEKLCVARDEKVGVYGFVFHRDGEWISEVVDDYLYLTKGDYDDNYVDRVLFNELERNNPEDAYRTIYQSNSAALYFAQCEHPQETWLPLLEKCYAKAHGDYAAIEGGFGGEGLEDLTGGVTSELITTDILDRDYFWNEELLKVNQDFLFSCSTGIFGSGTGDRGGIVEQHAYSIQKAVEIDGQRLVRLRNPWGKVEWKGPWSDGSKEWSAEWLQRLEHRFGDDGNFWISYNDLLRKYQYFDRTRLFDKDWHVAQIWTTLTVPWMVDYHDTHFHLTVTKPGPVVIVLSQLDSRYFRGLQGQYRFDLAIRVHEAGNEDYIVRGEQQFRVERSTNVELDLEPGEYDIRIKLDAFRDEDLLPPEQVLRRNVKDRSDKLMRIGRAYDLAHEKGKHVETPEEKATREAHEAKEQKKADERIKKLLLERRANSHYMSKKSSERQKRRVQRRRDKAKAKEQDRRARLAKMHAERRRYMAERAERAESERAAHAEKPSEPEEPVKDESAAAPPEDRAAPTAGQWEAELVHREVPGAPASLYSGPSRAMPYEEEEEDSDDGVSSVGDLSEVSERELKLRIENYKADNGEDDGNSNDSDSDDENKEFINNPWNAVVVVGLRVYHKIASGEGDDEAVKLRVVRKDPHGDEEEDEAEEKSKVLDVDDSAKDATTGGSLEEKKESIVGAEGV